MKKIYFVHDQQESPAARQNFLEMAGYELQMMTKGRELLVALKDEQPDLVLLDVLIEGRNGFEILAEVHRKYAYRRFPMILCSRIYRTRQFRDEALRNGAADYILLPPQLDDFLRRVNTVLSEWVPPDEDAELDVTAA